MRTMILLSCLLLLIAGACQQPWQAETDLEPFVCLIIYDKSLSAHKSVPPFDDQSIEQLFDLLTERGGILAYAEINAQSRYQPLLRLELEPKEGNLEQRAVINHRNIRKLQMFRNAILSTIMGRQAQKSDVLGALSRAATFFNEMPVRRFRQRFLVFMSDGEHDAPPLTHPRLPPDVTILTVGTVPEVAEQLFGQVPLMFESPAGMLSYLKNPQNSQEVSHGSSFEFSQTDTANGAQTR